MTTDLRKVVVHHSFDIQKAPRLGCVLSHRYLLNFCLFEGHKQQKTVENTTAYIEETGRQRIFGRRLGRSREKETTPYRELPLFPFSESTSKTDSQEIVGREKEEQKEEEQKIGNEKEMKNRRMRRRKIKPMNKILPYSTE